MPTALYRKYRPKKLEEVLGQESNILLLKNAARKDKFGHAYLFYGPRGTGKTTTARLVAKLLNCELRQSDPDFKDLGEPCNTCKVCGEIDENKSLSVIEIDAASNRGIEEVRNLKENIKTAPFGGQFKIYIIDEVHMLTKEAFNALLKTLEEPPSHAVLILATTEYEKLPPTITSRTQRFLFKKLPKVKILEKIKSIAHKEKIKIEEAALELIAAIADGSLRDAESLLDQVSSLEDHITLEAVEKTTGRVGVKKVQELAEFILKNDLKNSLKYLSELNEEGHNVTQLTKDLIHYLRKTIALSQNQDLRKFFESELTPDELKTMENLCPLADKEKSLKLLRSLIRAYEEMRYSPFASIPLEIALIESLA